MKITRHTAKDMRQALRLVRDQLGPDAVILTSKRTPLGVEVTAAVDFDAARFEAQAPAQQAPAPRQANPDPVAAEDGIPEHAAFREIAQRQAQQRTLAREDFSPAPVPAPAQRVRPRDAVNTSPDVHAAVDNAIDAYLNGDDEAIDMAALATPATASPVAASPLMAATTTNAESEMGAELKAMRRILETQMAQLAWNDLTRRAPVHTEILRELTEVGLSQDFAAQIVAQLPAGLDVGKARRLSIALIAQRMSVTGDRWLDKGGRVALVGPTGVGKTTALAKLAVRWVLRHGARDIALISADGVRIGAHDQLQALGQMLDVPVRIADSFNDIPRLLEELGPKRFVLIDTPGMSQRDAQLVPRMTQLAAAGHGIETTLVLSASTQAGAIAEAVKRYAAANATSCLITKVDEAASLGGILSTLTRVDLPVSYVSEGQRVPEDLRPARALELVSSAVQLAKASGAAADEDLLRRRYGDVAHALA